MITNVTSINFEDELRDVLIDAISNKFGITNKDEVLGYVSYRYCLIKGKTSPDKHIMDFILYELGAIGCTYDGVVFNSNSNINNIYNIYAELKEKFESIHIPILVDIRVSAKTKAKKWKETDYYDNYVLYFELEKLNNTFKAINKYVSVPNLRQRSKEKISILEDELNKLFNKNDTTTAFITEEMLEDYLVNHLDLIEDGLQYVDRQYVLPEGRIDILANDKLNNIVIIELKIDEDKKIVWQSVYYPLEIQKKYPNRNIRMVTIMKNYPSHLLEPLLELGIEMFEYDINIGKDSCNENVFKINQLELRKVGR